MKELDFSLAPDLVISEEGYSTLGLSKVPCALLLFFHSCFTFIHSLILVCLREPCARL